jgi:hypothetical protein
MATAVKIGNWDGVTKLISTLLQSCKSAAATSLNAWADYVEHEARFRVYSNLGFDWTPLAQSTKDRKAELGYPAGHYRETDSYANNIYSIVHKAQLVAFAGVSRSRSAVSGQYGELTVEENAAIQEFGMMATGLPARPLWGPSGVKGYHWLAESKNTPNTILMLLLAKKLLA